MTTQTDLQALLPCPFCGGEAVYSSWDRDPGYMWNVACSNKNCKIKPYVTGDDEDPVDVTEEWNTRAALSGDSVVDTQYGKIIDKQEKTIALLRSRIIELSAVDTQKIDFTACIKCNNPQPYRDLVNAHCRYCEDAQELDEAIKVAEEWVSGDDKKCCHITTHDVRRLLKAAKSHRQSLGSMELLEALEELVINRRNRDHLTNTKRAELYMIALEKAEAVIAKYKSQSLDKINVELDGWLPIESAPKGELTESVGCRGSSERFLGLHKSGEIMIIRRLPTMHSYDFSNDCDDYWTANNFIGWQPLPAPPKSQSLGG